MDFRHPDGRKVSVFLPRRSLLLMAGEARYLWTHGIAARQFDEVHSKMPGYSAAVLPSSEQSRVTTATTLPRGTRVSLTFRRVRRKPCLCDCGKCAIACTTSLLHDALHVCLQVIHCFVIPTST